MTKFKGPSGKKPFLPLVASDPIARSIVAIVTSCSRFTWIVLALSIVLTGLAGYYAANHFAINTNTNDFISEKLPWRQNLIALDKAFPQRADQIVVVIDGATPELAEAAAQSLTDKLKTRPDLYKSVVRPEGGAYFNQNGLLFMPAAELQSTMKGIAHARPFLVALASDPSLRGIANAFSYIPRGVQAQAGTLDDFDRPMAVLGDALDGVLDGRPTFFSWRGLLNEQAPDSRELRRFIEVKPVLDYAALMPGEKASQFIRQSAIDLGLSSASGVKIRLTGIVPMADEEFSTIADGAGLNALATALIVLFIIWRALKSTRIVLAVTLTVIVGLAVTAAVGIMMVGALNLISVAFAVLFVGIGVDFGIQFSVRYRAERHKQADFDLALQQAAAKAGRPLSLAAAATAAGFYSFLPTDYRGVSELGLIAGTGMFIAFFAAITVLPALLTLLRPPPEAEPVGYLFLAPVDKFMARHRYAIIIGTLAVALAGTPLLFYVHFDFNPLNLRSDKVESVSTILDLQKDPNTDTNTISVLAPSLADAPALMARLKQLPEVARVTSLESLIPEDQDQKLAIIAPIASSLLPLLDPAREHEPPTDAENVAALERAAATFNSTAGDGTGKGADDARRLAAAFQKLATGSLEQREAARRALVPSLDTMLDLLRASLSARKVTVASIPPDLARNWVSADGRARIEVAPAGDPNDNATLIKFAKAVRTIDPNAMGEPIAVQESGDTVVKAFIEAGGWALLSISLLLFFVLRRITDVLLTLVPLLLAGVVTLEITVLIGLPLNFANIIALPLLLGLGVAFKIYFVMAWRAGTTNLLQSSLTRAVFFSAMTTATAFGSLWLSNHPGTSSMGKLLALSLVCTLAAAILFQPALMGPPRKVDMTGEDA
ncbi:hopanoid biosynthesis-associated RND transporter HpnN [Beijerinckiaceae bacterium]|nr:hopanoid biosynthesis-associated RND transporter HpnN [Beijerinckiaceae bacterium]